jgi:hypothetical protein
MTVDGAIKSTPRSANCATAVSASMSRPVSATPMVSTSFTNSLARALATRICDSRKLVNALDASVIAAAANQGGATEDRDCYSSVQSNRTIDSTYLQAPRRRLPELSRNRTGRAPVDARRSEPASVRPSYQW